MLWSVQFAEFGTGEAPGISASPDCAAASGPMPDGDVMAIGVPSGGGGIARAVLRSGVCDAAGEATAISAGRIGGSIVAGDSPDSSCGGRPAPAGR